jgi:class 3 adenylate cyclase
MAFATVGDTINVASRLQAFTRELDSMIVASGALLAAVEREAVEGAREGPDESGLAGAARARHPDRRLGRVGPCAKIFPADRARFVASQCRD